VKGQQQFDNLQTALSGKDPACLDDPRFIADEQSYAEAGFWAGAQRGTSSRKRTTT
jgi:hypothetical protein